jgi:hypothetical protein
MTIQNSNHRMIVYSNSCSFGAPGQGHRVYADYVEETFDASLINQGKPSSCNRRILRTSLRDLIQIKQEHKKFADLLIKHLETNNDSY